MQILVGDVLDKIQQLHIEGINIQSSKFQGTKTLKVKLLMAVFDLPAQTNSLQFNGSYTCPPYCRDKGTHVMHRQVFLPDEQHEPQSNTCIEENARQAERPIRESLPFNLVWI